MKTLLQRGTAVAAAAFCVAAGAARADIGSGRAELTFTPRGEIVDAVPPLPPPSTYPVQLVIDDDNAEGSVGVTGQFARQFLWFNRFSPAAGFHLDEVWVLFPAGTNMPVGGAVQIAIYADADGDPANGATLLQSFDTTIQAVDGNTFSIYPLATSVTIPTGSDLLVGVVPRFIVSGVTSPTSPAALDTTASQSRSWLAIWSTDPPDPPALVPPPDQAYSLVDAFVPGGGNWMIRAFGTEQAVTEIPTLGGVALAVLTFGLGAAGAFLLRRRRKSAAVAAALLLLLLAAEAPAAAQVTIDSFTTAQATLSAPPDASSTATGGADIIGTKRGIVQHELVGAGPSTVAVAAGLLTLTVPNTTPDSRAEARLSWDNDNAPATLNPTGLAGANLTTGNSTGLRVRVASAGANAELEFTVYSSAADFSRAARLLPAIGASTDVFIPFTEFRVAGGTGANFASVGAIELTVRGKEIAVALDEIASSGPTAAATKTALQVPVDVDGDGRVDPGDRVRYTVTFTNTGNNAVNVDLTDTVDANSTLDAASVSSTPVARNDQYGWFGNVTLIADGTPFPTLLANDADPDGDTVTVQSVAATSAQGGTVTLVNANTGEFTYDPPAGFKGVDSFAYTIVDNDAHTSTATAYVNLQGIVWFVDDSNTTAPFNGTLADPFQTLAAVNSGSDADGPGDTIFVYDDDGTPYAGGLVLEADETLLGEGVGLILGGQTIVAVGGVPQITNGAGAGLTLSTNNTLSGFDVTGTSGAGIFGAAFGTLTASSVNVTGVGGSTLDLATGTLAATFGTLSSAGTGAQRGLRLDTVTGSLAATATTLTNPSTSGIRVQASPGVALNFGTTTVLDNAIGSGPTAIGVDLATGNAGASFTFASLSITSDGGAGLLANNSGTINIGGTTNSINATGGAAVDITSTSFGAGATFSTLSSNNSTAKGVNLDTVTGAFTANGGSISGAAANCFDINAGSGNITFTGSISCTASRVAEITNRTGGTVTLSGNLTGTGSATGINVASNTGGTVNFSGSSKTLSTSSGAAVTLASNTGSTINFTNGGLAITSTSGAGFNATGGASAITVQGGVNTISSGSGTALNVANSTIGASGLTLQSLSANGATKGFALNNTGSGPFTVTGTGTTDGSGGTIQNISQRGAELVSASNISLSNMNFTNANTTDAGGAGVCDDLATASCNAAIYLSSVATIALDNLNVTGTTVEEGLNGIGVSNLTLSNSLFGGSAGSACGNEVEEGCLKLRNLTGTCSISNSEFAFAGADTAEIVNTTGNLLLNVNNSIFRDTQSSASGNTGLQVRSQSVTAGNGVIVNVNSSSFLRIRTVGLQVTAINSAAADVDVTGSTFDPGAAPGTMIGIDLDADNSGILKFNVVNNPKIYSRNGPAMNVFGDTSAVIDGRINNNPDIQSKANPGGSQVGSGVRANLNKNASGRLEIKSNVINVGSDDAGIDLSGIGKTAANPGGSTSTLDATVTGNNITIGPTSTYGVVLVAASNAGDTNAICSNVATNAVTRDPLSIFSCRVRVASALGFNRLQGFVTNPEATWNANGNTPTSSGGSEVSFGGSGTFGACTATLPANPTLTPGS